MPLSAAAELRHRRQSGPLLRPPSRERTRQTEGADAETRSEKQGRVGACRWPERPWPDHGDGGEGSASHRGVISEGDGRHRPRRGLAGRVLTFEAPEFGG